MVKRKKKKKVRPLTLDDVDYEVSDGDTFIIDLDDAGDDFTIVLPKKRRRKRR